jgi:tetratricopeptide (TPR) repeat protein
MKKVILLSLLCLYVNLSQAQKNGKELIDSLVARVSTTADDTNKVKLLEEISFNFYSINPNEGINYGMQSLTLAAKLDWKQGMVSAHNTIGINYSFGKSDYPNAIEHYLKALKIQEKIGNEAQIASILNNIGTVYDDLKDGQKALIYYQKALAINEALGNKNNMANNLSNISVAYTDQKNYAKAIEYKIRALKLKEELGDTWGIATNTTQLGHIYGELKDYSKALELFFKSLSIFRAIGDPAGMAKNMDFIGTAYYTIVEEKDKSSIDRLFSGNITKALQIAKAYEDSAVILSKELGNLKALLENYHQLSAIQSILGDNQGALASYKQYSTLKDSVFNLEKNKKITEQSMQYEFDKKEAERKAEQEKKDIQQYTIRNTIIAGLIIAIIFIIVVFRNYRRQRQINQKLKETQEQLIQSEKLAAFGAVATRVAHEILNPLNFVNNFSKLSKELVDEILEAKDEEERKEIAQFLTDNLDKINYHGKRADDIVKELFKHTNEGTIQQYFEQDGK